MADAFCMIPLRRPASPSSALLMAALERDWPELAPLTGAEDRGFGVGLETSAGTVVTGRMDAPIPWGDLKSACAQSPMWPGAAEVLRPHTAHLVVTVISDRDGAGSAAFLTRVTATILTLTPEALGVYWGAAGLVTRKDVFVGIATELLPDVLPIHLWMRFECGWVTERKGWFGRRKKLSGGTTRGLSALGHMEFECPKSTETPAELAARLEGLVQYVLENGLVIRDGDTVGEGASEKIRATFAPSAFGNEGFVIRLG